MRENTVELLGGRGNRFFRSFLASMKHHFALSGVYCA